MTSTTIDIPGYKAGTWVLDPAHSEVTFSVRHMMISKVRGAFGVKSATLIAPENPLEVTIEASVDATSLDTNDEGRDAHLQHEANPTTQVLLSQVKSLTSSVRAEFLGAPVGKVF